MEQHYLNMKQPDRDTVGSKPDLPLLYICVYMSTERQRTLRLQPTF